MSDGDINRLPDPDLFRDAVFLSKYGTWSPTEMDAADALLLRLVKQLQTPARRSE